MLYLGVDGGNTKTIALLCTADGQVVGAGRAGCADMYHAPGVELALGEVTSAVDAALDKAGAELGSIDSAIYSLAGIDWPEDSALAHAHFIQRGYSRQCTVANDSLGGLRSGTDDGTGIVIAYGTGGIIGARNANGTFWHTGFWTEAMGGSYLGQEAIRLVMRAELGLEPDTALTALLIRQFNVTDVAAMVRLLNGHDIPALSNVERARLAPLVMSAAHDGDAVASGIVEQQARLVAEYAQVAGARVGLDPQTTPIVFTGGVFRHPGNLLSSRIAAFMQRPADSFRRPLHEPAIGALMLALEDAGIAVTADVLKNLSRTAPDARFYQTAGES